ncbi:methyltransferase [Fusarium mexicanum]|uniref:Methyltransferase n=1 Tax=Fusarium mexicanum TaxID=751941 RepID=A0A8H5IE69_9HYPO|nr:methyltransferase [Fusarium mexicanum]
MSVPLLLASSSSNNSDHAFATRLQQIIVIDVPWWVIQQLSRVPPNVQFLIDDIDEDWDSSKPFDYIHSRMMNFSVMNWTDYLRKGFENLASGGYMEVQEIDAFHVSDDGTLTEEHALFRWCVYLRDAAGKLGRPYEKTENLKVFMAEVGFTDIHGLERVRVIYMNLSASEVLAHVTQGHRINVTYSALVSLR